MTTANDLRRWRELTEPADVADAVVELYTRRGQNRYDEAVTQAEHARQCGAHAMAVGSADSLVVAAFLHDIGHLLLDQSAGGEVARDRDRRHEEAGSRFLTTWFSETVTEPIRLHVPAKRYLCAFEPGYVDGLSPASVRSLRLQGGPMSPDEGESFDSLPHHEAAIELRRWDDEGKVPGAPTPPLEAYRALIVDVLTVPTR